MNEYHWLSRLFTGLRRANTINSRKRRRRSRAVEPLECRILLSADLQLVKDINNFTIRESSEPRDFTAVGGTIYFTATDSQIRDTFGTAARGRELWRTNGTFGGTMLVSDILPGGLGSNPESLINVNGTLFFTAVSEGDGRELWRTDGTEAGTLLVRNIGSGALGSDPAGLTNLNGVLYFSADDRVNGRELWRSDGTEAGTVMVRNIRPGAQSADPSGLFTFQGALWFSANDGINGHELWKSDGTSAGTRLFKSINPAGASSWPAHFVEMNGDLYFSATDALHGNELWKSDGTDAGTMMVKDIIPGTTGTGIDSLTNFNGSLLFRVQSPSDEFPYAWKLWTSNGTDAGTQSLNVMASPLSSAAIVGNSLFFAGDAGETGNELWKTDGTISGTVLVKDLWPGEFYYEFTFFEGEWRKFAGRPEGFQNLNGTLYFVADDGVNGREVWTTDGTADGTVLLKDMQPSTLSGEHGWDAFPRFFPSPLVTGPTELTSLNGALYFSAYNAQHGSELWRSDGTASGTNILRNLAPDLTTSDSRPSDLLTINGVTFFVADDGVHGRELWRTDGTVVGTRLVKDIRTGSASSAPASLTNVNGVLYFSADDGSAGRRNYAPGSIGSGRELWKSDGTTEGTLLVANIASGYYFHVTGSNGLFDLYEVRPNSSHPNSLTNVNGTLFFTATDGQSGRINGTPTQGSGRELWKTDGTAAGTVLVKDIREGVYGSEPGELTAVGGRLYFHADDSVNGDELWSSDGTNSGTVMVRNVRPGAAASSPRNLTSVNSILYFTANDGAAGVELWKSDGTAAGTSMVRNLHSGSVGSQPSSLTNVNGVLYFVAHHIQVGRELWKSDGTLNGTVVVKDLRLGLYGSAGAQLVNVNGTLFFSADNGIDGRELWQSDGTADGTRMVSDTASGAQGSDPFTLTNVNGWLYFAADSRDTGVHLYRTRGADSGVERVLENFAGRRNDTAGLIHVAGQRLYVTHEADPFGNELLSADLASGTSGDDLFIVRYSGPSVGGTVTLTRTVPGQPAEFLGTFSAAIPLKIDGLGGYDSLRILTTVHNDVFLIRPEGLVINGSHLRLANIESRMLAGLAGNDIYRFVANAPLGTWTINEHHGGVDTLDFSLTTQAVSVNLGTSGFQTVNPALRLSLGSGTTLERVHGGAGNDTLVGNSLHNFLRGNSGHDVLIGGTGDDVYDFGTAAAQENDVVMEGADGGTDTLRFSSLNSSVNVNLGTSTIQTVHSNRTLRLSTRIYIENVQGGSGHDRILGNASANILVGGAGNDVLMGLQGDDSLIGGVGNDTYVFGTASTLETDVVTEGSEQGEDTLDFRPVASLVMVNLNLSTTQDVHRNRRLRLNTGLQFERVLEWNDLAAT